MKSLVTRNRLIYIPFEKQTGTRNDGVAEVPANGAQRVSLDHAAQVAELARGLGVVDLVDEADLLHEGEISPVDTLGGEGVVGQEDLTENVGLLAVHVANIGGRDVVAGAVGPMGRGETVVSH